MATTSSRASHGHRSAPQTAPGGGSARVGGGSGGRGGSGGGRGPKRRRPNPFARVFWFLVNLALIIALIAAAVVAAMVLATLRTMPTTVAQIENYRPSGQTVIYSSDGVILAKIFEQDRETVTIDKIPAQLQNATVAIEDSRFWSNNSGFDVRGIGRALWKDAFGGDATAQGGSTITQQLVRNLGIGGVGFEKTWQRKVREVIYANQIERNYSKQQILEMYLNAVYYGSGAYGVQAASEVYFGKTVDQLDLAQCALLAGLPQYPNGYSPYNHLDAALTRRNVVLGRMHDLGYISDDQYTQALAEPIHLASIKQPDTGSKTFHAPYFVDYVKRYLTNEWGPDFIYRGGINVYTTLNWQMQQAAEHAVAQDIADMSYTGADQAALVCMEAQTGYIKAMVGGVDYTKSEYNIALGRRQPGSSFKPIYYTAALDSGLITEKTLLSDEPISFPGVNGVRWSPHNDNDEFGPPVTAKTAIELSMNVPSVRVLQLVGIDTAIRYARMMGVKSPLAPYMPLALGASAVTPLEMADVYATIDNGGARPIPTPVEQITDDTGQILEDDPPKLETTGIGADACAQMSDMLRGVVTEGTAYLDFRDDNPPDAHGKTGTTQNHNDVWFDGYTKDLVTTVWAGHPTTDPKTGKAVYGLPMTNEAFGATICAPIWKDFMVAATAIEKTAQAREAKLDKSAPQVIIPPSQPAAPQTANQADDSTSTDSSDDSDDSDDNAADVQNSTDDSSQTGDQSDSGDNGDNTNGTTTVWIDNDTGQPTTPNAPNSHKETFARGYAPATPTAGSGGSNADDSSAAESDDGAGSGAAANGTGGNDQNTGTGDDSQSNGPQGGQNGNTGAATAPARPARAAQASPKLVTVTICADSGLLATRWCPETITETFVAGTQPKKYCTLHKPPPGEH